MKKRFHLLIRLRSYILTKAIDFAKPIYSLIRRDETSIYPLPLLRCLPDGSLGNSVALFLDQNHIEIMPHFESHDMFHVILDYGTTVEEEARMQFFLVGNGKRSLFAIGTVLVALITMPEYFFVFLQDFRRGRDSEPIYKLQFCNHVYTSINYLKSHLSETIQFNKGICQAHSLLVFHSLLFYPILA